MLSSQPRWSVKITHIPTGIEVVRTSWQFRNQHLARESAMKYLRSRLYMLGYGGTVEEEIFEIVEVVKV